LLEFFRQASDELGSTGLFARFELGEVLLGGMEQARVILPGPVDSLQLRVHT
jgi:hypothetical protein